MSKSLNMNLYFRGFSIAVYKKFDLYYLYLFIFFSGLHIVQFWSVNYISYFRPSQIYGQCLYWRILVIGILRRVSFNSYLLFQLFFLVCNLYIRSVNQVYISSNILNMAIVLFEGFQYLVFQFLAFLSILSLLFLAIFPDLELLKFWFVNYICQVCKLYFCFGHIQSFGQYLYLSVFSKN